MPGLLLEWEEAGGRLNNLRTEELALRVWVCLKTPSYSKAGATIPPKIGNCSPELYSTGFHGFGVYKVRSAEQASFSESPMPLRYGILGFEVNAIQQSVLVK